MDIIRIQASSNGLLTSELFLQQKKKVDNLCLQKIYHTDIIRAKKLIVRMILSK